MMLWVNLIMDTMGALALVSKAVVLGRLNRPLTRSPSYLLQGTENPTPALLDRRPYSASASLVQPRMIRNVMVQSVFQFSLLISILLRGEEWFGVSKEFVNITRELRLRSCI
jgi:hypothetical protein